MKLSKKQIEQVNKMNADIESAQKNLQSFVNGIASAFDFDEKKEYTLDLEKGEFIEVKKK